MKKLIFLFIISKIIFSCCNENDDNTKIVTNELNGKWNLISVSCLCEPIDLEAGEHIWDFDIDKNQLNVENNVTESLHTILETGTYNITLTNDTVTVENITYDYYFEDGKLYLSDNPESDGTLISFVK